MLSPPPSDVGPVATLQPKRTDWVAAGTGRPRIDLQEEAIEEANLAAQGEGS